MPLNFSGIVLYDAYGLLKLDFGRRRINPTDRPVALKPRHLLLGIDPRVLRKPGRSRGQIPFAIYMTQHLLDANRIKRIQMAEMRHTAYLRHKPLLHHCVHSSVDAAERSSRGVRECPASPLSKANRTRTCDCSR